MVVLRDAGVMQTEWELEHPDGGTFTVPIAHYALRCKDDGVRIMQVPTEIEPLSLIRRKWSQEERDGLTGEIKLLGDGDLPDKPRAEWTWGDFA